MPKNQDKPLQRDANHRSENPSQEPLTRQQSENMDVGEKQIESPINPNSNGLKTEQSEKQTVLSSAKGKPQR